MDKCPRCKGTGTKRRHPNFTKIRCVWCGGTGLLDTTHFPEISVARYPPEPLQPMKPKRAKITVKRRRRTIQP
jgi:hypothetical protein